MLMPWTPLTAIFTDGEELRVYGVPKLKALAAAALQVCTAPICGPHQYGMEPAGTPIRSCNLVLPWSPATLRQS